MSTQEKVGSMDCLFSRQDNKTLVNIKFMRGTDGVIAADDFRAEVCGVVARRDAGMQPSGPTHSGRTPVDVRKMVANG
jgi:hypothetical protein